MLKKFKLLCSILGLLLLSHAALAAQMTLKQGAAGEADMLTILGPFKEGDDRKFRALALQSRNAVVYLDSGGGLMFPALDIGRMIRMSGFATAVQGAQCTSACALVWLAGQSRMMNNMTSIGFHGPFHKDSKGNKVMNAMSTARVGAYLTELGFGEKVLDFVISAQAPDIHWLKKGDADRLGISVSFSTPARQLQALQDFAAGLKAHKDGRSSDAEAARLYTQSADAGFAGAQNNLGDLYELGAGVHQNDHLAIYWYTRAAERGEPTAYLSLAAMLDGGSRSADALIESAKFAALAYATLAEGRNKAKAKALVVSIGAKLTDTQRQRVMDLIEQWVPLYQEAHLMGDMPAGK